MAITERFTNGSLVANCRTVGDVIEELSGIPSDAPIRTGDEESVDIIILDAKRENACVGFDEGGTWDEEDFV